MPLTEANGQRLYFEAHGAGEPLLCVMGLGSDSSGWAGQLPLWSEHHRTIVFDNRDCGRSSYVSGDYEVRDMAADALGVADALGLERFHLLGISMGGAIAQELALATPDRLGTLTLVVSYGGGGRWMRERARFEAAASEHTSDDELIDQMMLLTVSEETYENERQMAYQRELIRSYPHRQRREGFLRQLRASSRHEARDRLRAVRIPTHVIGAERDLLVPVWKSRELAGLIPGAELTVIAGSGHAVNVERAEQLAGEVLRFLAASPLSPVPA